MDQAPLAGVNGRDRFINIGEDRGHEQRRIKPIERPWRST